MPEEKANRKNINYKLNLHSIRILEELSNKTDKTRSEVFSDAIRYAFKEPVNNELLKLTFKNRESLKVNFIISVTDWMTVNELELRLEAAIDDLNYSATDAIYYSLSLYNKYIDSLEESR